MSTDFPGDLTSGFSEPIRIGSLNARGVHLGNGVVYVASIDGSTPWRELGIVIDDGLAEVDTEEVVDFGGRLQRVVATTVRTSFPAPEGVDILDQIDRAVARLCPCGAEPSEEFAPYCSYDCKPTHRGEDTSSESDGTPMRWRPDLVSVVDDSTLVPFLPRRRIGQFWAEIFERPGAEEGTRCFHLRLDDGHRFVGTDMTVPADIADPEELHELWSHKWDALRAQLESNRLAVPGVPPVAESARWAHAVNMAYLQRRRSAASGRAVDISPHVHWVNPPRDRLAEIASALRALGAPLYAVGAAASALVGRMRVWGVPRPVEPASPNQREETLRRVREGRNAGPQNPPRAPRRIDPRRGR